LIGVLINDLLEIAVRPFVLVLDDLHVVQAEESLQLLEALIEHLPGHFRLVLASRTDPVMSLPLLRSRGRLAEFRLDQLRFSSLEISKFLQPYIDSKLSSEDVQRIKDRTEGWAALLRLLTIKSSLISGSQVSDVFSGESQQSDLHIFDFLAEEVLGQLPQHEREFLVKTSILPNLNEDLCKAVTNQPASAEILEALHRRNLVYFLGSVPSKSGQFQINQYRYHDLFAEFLVSRLGRSSSESEIQDLHIRAAQSQPDTEQALQHMLWAEQWDDAAMLISHLGNQMVFMGFLDTLNDWIAQIPAVTRQTIPELAYFSGVIAFQRGRFDHAQQQLELALAGFEDAGNDQKKGETILVLGAIASGFRKH
jgi:LuxR family maltose regulon positive regulatory protein